MGNFYRDVIRQDPRFEIPKRIADLDLLEPKTRELVTAVIAEAAATGMVLTVFETFRSQARQAMLIEQRPGAMRTTVHHFGLAADVVKMVDGEPSWKGSFDFLGTLARRNGLIWGGDWGVAGSHPQFVDAVHVQRVTVARQQALFNGTWYPDDNYDPYRDH